MPTANVRLVVTPEWIAARVKVDENGCWIWQKAVHHSGYGVSKVARMNVRMHRVSYEVHVGPIPDGLVIDHLCRVRRCVNPSHLEPVTWAENARRGEPATKTHCVNGHPLSGDNLGRGTPRKPQRYCKTCKREQSRAWVAANPERRREIERAHRRRRAAA